jgi:hypothetical protein
MSLKFVEHFLWIASAMGSSVSQPGCGMTKTVSITTCFGFPRPSPSPQGSVDGWTLAVMCGHDFRWGIANEAPELSDRLAWFLESRPELRAAIHDPAKQGVAGRIWLRFSMKRGCDAC